MDSMSGRARLARNNINILGVTYHASTWLITYEFQYRLPTGAPVWRKTFGSYPSDEEQALMLVLDDVRALRRELENDESRNQD